MMKLVIFTDAGESPVYVNPEVVTFVARPAIEMFGNATINFVGGQTLTVKEHPEAVVQALTAGD
ncbi:MAG TPA: hypothetical protein VMU59_07150 [Caulobacteraceae bacterium]|nr:hypothetical protein [Caulobacteraceae bacterium]